MKHPLLSALSLLLPSTAVLAQAPVLLSLTPLANATAVPRTATLTATFSQPLALTSADALRVFSTQRGGLRTRRMPATVSGNTLAFTPSAYPFLPGETVQYTITTAATGSGGAVARPRVGQFTTAVGTANTGIFAKTVATPSPVPTQYNTYNVALGDVDGDGDVDLLFANGYINLRLNDGLGNFSGTQQVGLGEKAVFGDIDNDGDLDLLASNWTNVVSVQLNDGNGTFSSGQEVTLIGKVFNLTLGDVDGDGDLDLVGANTNGWSASVRLNDGRGTFTGGSEVVVTAAWDVALGDVDNDGDLDLVVVNNNSGGTTNICLNNGNGTFLNSQAIAVDALTRQAVLGDVDQDGDLDLLVTTTFTKTPLSLYRNDGTGTFGTGQSLYTDSRYIGPSIALADVEGDGDVDILLAVTELYSQPPFSHTWTVGSGYTTLKLVNDGTGGFAVAETIAVGSGPQNVAVGDVNGDGGLDFVTSDYESHTATVRLNGHQAPLAARTSQVPTLALFPNPAHRMLTLTGISPRAIVQVVDILGRVVYTDSADMTGTAHLALPVELPIGTYLVRSDGQVCRLTLE